MSLALEPIKRLSNQNKPLLNNSVKDSIIQKVLLIRKLEEALLDLYAKGELYGTVHTCIGQEFTGAIVSEFLRPGDSIFSNHRCHGHFLSITDDAEGLMAEIFGKETGVCGGRGGSQHLCKNDFYSNGIQGGMVPVAAGQALAKKLNHSEKISVVFVGDGTLGEGVIYEVFNIASKWNLPLLIVLENNKYAQSTHQSETLAGDIVKRAQAFNILTKVGNTQDWQDLYFTTEEIVNYVRSHLKPAFLQVDTYRLKAHSKGDDNRSKHEIQHFEALDPLNNILKKNTNALLNVCHAVEKRINAAVDFARSSSYPSVQDFCSLKINKEKVNFNQCSLQDSPELRVSSVINNAFKKIMQENNKVMFIGEDVKSPYGGAFKISSELSDLFPDRVMNTPISEAAIVGIASGLAMEGYRPFVEIMFGDFITLAFDQILNHASKFTQMFNNQVSVPLVIRTPMGGGRGYGPTHSQTLDKHFLGIPGLTILAINNLIDPTLIYETLAQTNESPVLMIENKLLYTKYLRRQMPKGFDCSISDEKYPTVVVSPKSSVVDLTLIGYGGLSDLLVDVMERLFYEHEIIAQLLLPTQIFPFYIINYQELVSRGKFLFLVEEGQTFAGFGSEIIAQLAESNVKLQRLKRIAPPNTIIPACKPLENSLLPTVESVVQSIVRVVYEKNNSSS